MEAHISNARALDTGEYDFTGANGERYRYITLYDEASGKNLRFSIDKDCTPPAVEFGTLVNVWVRFDQSEKIVRGEDRDRSIGQLKLKAVNIELAAAAKLKRAA